MVPLVSGNCFLPLVRKVKVNGIGSLVSHQPVGTAGQVRLDVPSVQAPGVVVEGADLEIRHCEDGLARQLLQRQVACETGLALQTGGNALSMKYWGGPFQWLQFCDKFQLPFLELLFSCSIFESKTKST